MEEPTNRRGDMGGCVILVEIPMVSEVLRKTLV
jgi:hypothetical protein